MVDAVVHVGELGGRDGTGEDVALPVLAAQSGEGDGLFEVLDAFGHDGEPEGATEVDDRFDEAGVPAGWARSSTKGWATFTMSSGRRRRWLREE
jgi:hypothetical protein